MAEPINTYAHEIAITALVRKDNKYLVLRRLKTLKRWPGMWTVPGGRLETTDYVDLPKDTDTSWYNVLERTLKREVKEEAGIEITNVEYLTSIASIVEGKIPMLILSCVADYASGDITLEPDEADEFRWVSLEEAKQIALIDGIYDEFVMAEQQRLGTKQEWQRFEANIS